MEIWIPITIAAAFLQNLRSMLQKHLKAYLSTMGATFARFIYALPVSMSVLALLIWGAGYEFPTPNIRFLGFATIGALTQISATFLLVHLFGLRNFAIGTTFSKTEAVQTAMVGFVLLGERISLWAGLGLLLSLTGVVILSGRPKSGGGLFSQATMIGLGAGAAFGVSSVCYRGASLALPSGDFLIRGATLLAFTTLFQTIFMLILLRLRQPGQISSVIANWRIGALVGLAGGLASLGWFTAMTLQNAAYVRALAQVELLFTFGASWLFFKEKISVHEAVGILLVAGGVLLLVVLS